jgi:HAD superfamily hydrolase (TIGR01509 family)
VTSPVLKGHRPTVVLFDWDGTLVDTGNILLSCWHAATEQVLGYRFPVEEEDRRRVLAMRAVDSFPTITDGPEQTAQLTAAFDAVYEPLAPLNVRAHDGALALLRSLRDRGIRIGVVTSKTAVRRAIDGRVTGLDPYVDLFVTGDDVTHGKPHPEGIEQAMAALGGTTQTTVYVGDGPVDARAGGAAGVRTICLTHGLHSAEEFAGLDGHLLVTDLHDVAQMLEPGVVG